MDFEIKQDLVKYEQRKRKQTLENYSGSWRLFGGLEVQPNPHYPTLFYSTYADIKKLA